MSTSVLIWSFLFSSIGLGYLIYGKKQRKATALLSGAMLCFYPYFVPNVYLLVAIGVGLVALPFSTEY